MSTLAAGNLDLIETLTPFYCSPSNDSGNTLLGHDHGDGGSEMIYLRNTSHNEGKRVAFFTRAGGTSA